MSSALPVTLIGGFLGAGKTSLVHYLVSEHHGGHLAILIENPGPLNLDAKAIRGLCGAMRRTNDAVFEIPNGDDGAQLQAIAACLRDLSLAGRYERVLIEVAGTTNPARLAAHFLPGGMMAPFADLQQVICVVDALEFLRTGAGPGTGLWNFQNEQVAGSTLVVLNKCDLLDDKENTQCLGIVRDLHPDSRVIQTAYGEVSPEVWARPPQKNELAESVVRRPRYLNDTSEIWTADLATALYRVHRPFHPARFWDWFNADHHGLLRVKGIVWLATRNLLVGGTSRTRWQNSCGAAGIWWAALPREDWPHEPDALLKMQEVWQEPYGDRRQELVLIGETGPLSATIRPELDACLLTDQEFAKPLKEWASFPDPFPAWDLEQG